MVVDYSVWLVCLVVCSFRCVQRAMTRMTSPAKGTNLELEAFEFGLPVPPSRYTMLTQLFGDMRLCTIPSFGTLSVDLRTFL